VAKEVREKVLARKMPLPEPAKAEPGKGETAKEAGKEGGKETGRPVAARPESKDGRGEKAEARSPVKAGK